MLHSISDKAAERITDGVAVGAISSWWWMEQVEPFFSALLPIMGCLWLGIQIWHWVRTRRIK